jgi:hypothetical protein
MQAFLPLYFLAILDGFGEVVFSDSFAAFEISNCAGDFEGFEVGASRQIEMLGGIVKILLSLSVKPAISDRFGRAEGGIKFITSVKLCVQSFLNKFFGSLVFVSASCCIFY